MIVHTVIFTWKAGVSREQVTALSDALDALRDEVTMVRNLHHGADLNLREGNGDYVLVATFDNEDGWREYQAHPAHKMFVAEFVAPLQQHRIAAQIRVQG